MMYPILPVPYPDENLYSLFSRYHMRSANRTSAQSKEDLFGNTRTGLVHTSTSSYSLWHLKRWGLAESAYTETAYNLLTKHTPYPIYAPFDFSGQCASDMQNIVFERQKKSRYTYRLHTRTGSTPFSFRYCPVCAMAEFRIYGEPYWHVAHQIPAVRYCGIHGVALQEIRVERSYADSHFCSAYKMLKAPFSGHSLELDEEENKVSAIAIAKDVEWLFGVGHKEEFGYRSMKTAYDRMVADAGLTWHSYMVKLTSAWRKANDVTQSSYEKEIYDAEHVYSLPVTSIRTPIYHLVFIRTIVGSIRTFHNRYLCSGK